MAIRTGTGRGQLWSPYKSWTHSMQSSEQPCWRVVQPGCQGWLKDIFYTGVFLTESNFPARSTIVALFFLKGDSSSGKCHLSPYRNWSTASTPGHSERAAGPPLVSAAIYPMSAAWHRSVILSLIRLCGGEGRESGSGCYCYSDRLTPAGDSWIRRTILHPGVSPSLINLFVQSGHAKCNAVQAERRGLPSWVQAQVSVNEEVNVRECALEPVRHGFIPKKEHLVLRRLLDWQIINRDTFDDQLCVPVINQTRVAYTLWFQLIVWSGIPTPLFYIIHPSAVTTYLEGRLGAGANPRRHWATQVAKSSGRQSITGLTHRDGQLFTFSFAPMEGLRTSILKGKFTLKWKFSHYLPNLTAIWDLRACRNLDHTGWALWSYSVVCLCGPHRLQSFRRMLQGCFAVKPMRFHLGLETSPNLTISIRGGGE